MRMQKSDQLIDAMGLNNFADVMQMQTWIRIIRSLLVSFFCPFLKNLAMFRNNFPANAY